MPDPTLAELLSPATLARIENYALLAKVAVEGFISGMHRSLYHGFGTEFFQYRSYAPGDDLKYVDWKVFARRNRFYSKVYQEETNMNCCILMDASASMDYEGKRASCTKWRYASMVAACIAYLATRQGDNVGLYAFNHELLSAVPPGFRTGGLRRVLSELQRLRPGGQAEPGKVIGPLAEKLQRRGIVIIISDLLNVDEDLSWILKRFTFSRHECVVFHVLDPDELDFPFTGTMRFVDSESLDEIVTAPQLAKDYYQESMDTLIKNARRSCLEQQVDYEQVKTSDNLGNMLAAYLHRRESLTL